MNIELLEAKVKELEERVMDLERANVIPYQNPVTVDFGDDIISIPLTWCVARNDGSQS